MSQSENRPSHDELIQNYLENEATPTEEKQFRLLLGEESFRRRVAEYAIDLGCLYSYDRQGTLDRALTTPATPDMRSRRLALAVAVVAASLLLGVVMVRSVFRDDKTSSDTARGDADGLAGNQRVEPIRNESIQPVPRDVMPTSAFARAAHVIGPVVVSRSSDPAGEQVVDVGTALQSGDVLRTVDVRSFALVEFHDGTVLAVAGKSELTCTLENDRKRIMIADGDIMAQVAPQAKLSPMIIATPIAEAEVLGTRLSLYTDTASTELAVHEGRVQFRNLADGQSIHVAGGECAVARADSELVARPIESVPSVWEEDFDAGLPERWGCGMWVRSDLLVGSNGAVRAVPRSEGDSEQAGACDVATGRRWSHGLFRIEENTYLNFKYKLTMPGWFYITIRTRGDDPIPVTAGDFIYMNREMWQVPRNQWQTRCIPLSQFKTPERDLAQNAVSQPPKPGNIAYSLFFRTRNQDPGLMIDRIWITRGAPEAAEVSGPSE